MALTSKRPWILAYDIADPRRLGRVHRAVKRVGVPIQYSVYFLEMNPVALGAFLRRIERIIDDRADDVRAYPIPVPPDCSVLGASLLPDSALLRGGGDSPVSALLKSRTQTEEDDVR